MSQPTPPVNPGEPTPTTPAISTLASVPAKRNSRTLIILSVVGGLVALCCLAGIIAAVNAGDGKPTADATLPEGIVAEPGQQATQQQPASEPTKAPEPALPPGTITDQGTLLVGTDIPPGTYRGVGCRYWERMKDANGDLDSILANGNAGSGEHVTVTILATDYGFQSSCAHLLPVAALRTVAATNTTSEEFGTLIVGKDIHPGTWRGTATGHCYWARLGNFTGDLDSIHANDNVNAGAKFTINVKASDKGLELGSDCGPMTKA